MTLRYHRPPPAAQQSYQKSPRLFVADFDGIKLLLTANVYHPTRYRLMILVALTTFLMSQVRMLIRSLGLIREFRDVDGEEI